MSSTPWKRIGSQYAGLVVALGVLVLVFSFSSRNFVSRATFSTVVNSIPDLTIVAVGMTLVLVLGGIDLSVGSVMALAGSVLAMLMVDGEWPLWWAAIVAVLVGCACGLLNGLISIRFRIPSFIVTLGMLEIARGAAYQVTHSETKYIGRAVEWLSGPLPVVLASPAFLLALGIVVGGQWLLQRTVLGRMTVAIGTNPETVRLSGVPILPYSLSCFGLSGVLCGLAAIVQISRLGSADPNAGIGMELNAIAACVIGGTSLRGGSGSVIATFFGVLIVSVLQTGLAHLGTPDPLKRIVTGGVIIAAVLIDSWRRGTSPAA